MPAHAHVHLNIMQTYIVRNNLFWFVIVTVQLYDKSDLQDESLFSFVTW